MGNIRILAKRAVEVTPCRSKGVTESAGKDMIQGFFFNKVHMPGDRSSIDQTPEHAVPVFPHHAPPSFSWGNIAGVSAQKAAHHIVFMLKIP